jgi:hypothetical protein
MRHGIPVVAIREFLSEKLPNALAAVAGSQENPLDVG